MKKEIDCPHCSGKIKLAPKEVKEVEVDYFDNTSSTGQQTQQIQIPPPLPPKEQEKKLTHDEMAELIPKGRNFSSCPGRLWS